jgi:dipeptidyl aminopeptidase/acylaminoacyl peptidase
MFKTNVAALAALFLVLANCSASAQTNSEPRLDDRTEAAIRASVERQRVIGNRIIRPQFDVSADGARLVVAVQSPSIATNLSPVDLWLVEPDAGSEPRILLRVAERFRTNINPVLDAAGHRIAFIGEKENGATAPALFHIADNQLEWLGAGLPDEGATVSAMSWSPDGTRLAVMFVEGHARPLAQGVAVDVGWEGQLGATHVTRLAILDPETGERLGTSPENVSVDGRGAIFSWSPDGARIAFSGHYVNADNNNQSGTDIYVLDTNTYGVEVVVSQPGMDIDPAWSTDGRRIAFLSVGGTQSLRGPSQLNILDVRSGRQTALAPIDGAAAFSHQWLDAHRVVYAAASRMGCPAFIGDVRSARVIQLSPDDLTCLGALRAASRDSFYALRGSFSHPAELVEAAVEQWHVRTVFPFSSIAEPIGRQRVIDWAVPGNPERVHGILIEPATASTTPRPLLVILAGGPSMVTPDSYNDDAQQLIQPALLRGYAVLIPNTRGRGGYGQRFARLIRDHGDLLPGPFDDMMAGVDTLIEAGTADPSRLALAGFSYGGILASYSATRTQRFRAIMAFEGATDQLSRAREAFGGPSEQLAREIFGFANPYDARERALITAQSPIEGAGNLQTPTLLECGAENLAPTECIRFLRAVRRRSDATIELIVYPRSGHTITEPALRYDSARRQALWLDRWIGNPSPNPAGISR